MAEQEGKTAAQLEKEIADLKAAHAKEVSRLKAQIQMLRDEMDLLRPPPSGGEIKYGMPDAPRRHLLVLKEGSMEICGSQEQAASRLHELGLENVKEVWEMRKRTVVG